MAQIPELFISCARMLCTTRYLGQRNAWKLSACFPCISASCPCAHDSPSTRPLHHHLSASCCPIETGLMTCVVVMILQPDAGVWTIFFLPAGRRRIFRIYLIFVKI